MNQRALVACLLLVGCGTSSNGDDGDDASAFEDDCGAVGSCGQLSARWTIKNHTQAAMCAGVGGATVTLTATFQADGRVAQFSNGCDAGAILTSKLPLGPYALTLALSDANQAKLAATTATVTLGVAGSIAEAQSTFEVALAPSAGAAFGACLANHTCNAGLECATFGTSSFCTPSCQMPYNDPACRTAATGLGTDPAYSGCFPVDQNAPAGNCVIQCDDVGGTGSGSGSGDPPCPTGLTCREGSMWGPLCVP